MQHVLLRVILLAGLFWAAACGDHEAETGSTNATNPDEVEAGDYLGTCYNDPDSDGLAENDFSQPSTEPCSSDSWHLFAPVPATQILRCRATPQLTHHGCIS